MKKTVAFACIFLSGGASANVMRFDTRNVLNAGQALQYAISSIQRYKLIELGLQCFTFDTTEERSAYEIRVGENHTPECGGDPETGPTRFFMKVWKKGGRIRMTNFDNSEFIPVPEAAKRLRQREKDR